MSVLGKRKPIRRECGNQAPRPDQTVEIPAAELAARVGELQMQPVGAMAPGMGQTRGPKIMTPQAIQNTITGAASNLGIRCFFDRGDRNVLLMQGDRPLELGNMTNAAVDGNALLIQTTQPSIRERPGYFKITPLDMKQIPDVEMWTKHNEVARRMGIQEPDAEAIKAKPMGRDEIAKVMFGTNMLFGALGDGQMSFNEPGRGMHFDGVTGILYERESNTLVVKNWEPERTLPDYYKLTEKGWDRIDPTAELNAKQQEGLGVKDDWGKVIDALPANMGKIPQSR